MAKGQVEIHDPFSNHKGLASCAGHDPKSTSDSDSMEDTVELRLLMAYAKRRRPRGEPSPQDRPTLVSCGTDANGSSSPQTPNQTEKEVKKKRKNKRWKRLLGIFSCTKRQTQDEDLMLNQPDVQNRCAVVEGKDELEEVASRLTKIADEIPFVPPQVETDAAEDENVERVIGLLLRESGDRLNDKELVNAAIATELFWNYSFFNKLMTALLSRMGLRTPDPASPVPKASHKTQIAVTCEVTSRLSAVDTLPRNRLLDHGARFLQHYYSPWAQQQGGYEEAFYSDDEDDIQ